MGSEELAFSDLDFEAGAAVDPPSLYLRGSADATIVKRLKDLIGRLHEALLARRTREIAVDIRNLEFMNAMCFNVFVNWIGMLNDLGPDERYQLRFTINSAIPWQRRSLHTLSCFATDLVVVQS